MLAERASAAARRLLRWVLHWRFWQWLRASTRKLLDESALASRVWPSVLTSRLWLWLVPRERICRGCESVGGKDWDLLVGEPIARVVGIARDEGLARQS